MENHEKSGKLDSCDKSQLPETRNERTGPGGSDPTDCPLTAKRAEGKEEVKSGERESNGTSSTAHVHGRSDAISDLTMVASDLRLKAFEISLSPNQIKKPRESRYLYAARILDAKAEELYVEQHGERSGLNDEPPKTEPCGDVRKFQTPENQAERSVDARAVVPDGTQE